jgi:mono/diheme cytochrome c family protein
VAIGLVWIGLITLAKAAPPLQSPEEGQAIFQQRCAPCHTIGGGKLVGPDLQRVANLRDRDWLARWIAEPDKMLAEGDPLATELLQEFNNIPMPNLGLTQSEVASLIAYLESGIGTAAGPQPVALPAGDPMVGKDLFTGVLRFQNGGPPCMACHSIAGIGALGGGSLGPDLTPAFNKYGEVGLASFLGTMPLPVMNAVWSSQPLTPQEQADLWVFLQQAAVAERSAQAVGQLAVLAVIGAAALIVLAHFLWRRRLRGVRRLLVGRPA